MCSHDAQYTYRSLGIRLAEKNHLVPLRAVARLTRWNDVLWRVPAALAERDDMIEC